jgi:hypothetical protein
MALQGGSHPQARPQLRRFPGRLVALLLALLAAATLGASAGYQLRGLGAAQEGSAERAAPAVARAPAAPAAAPAYVEPDARDRESLPAVPTSRAEAARQSQSPPDHGPIP